MEYFPVEIQFRTMSMDFWASMEHRINYKKERQDREKLVKELKEHARKLEKIEKALKNIVRIFKILLSSIYFIKDRT